jgi:hypothetical protein
LVIHLHIASDPAIDRVGDVFGVVFPDEQEAVLFVPNAGDVLLCTVREWSDIKEAPVSGPVDPTSSSGALRPMLLGLGALLG